MKRRKLFTLSIAAVVFLSYERLRAKGWDHFS